MWESLRRTVIFLVLLTLHRQGFVVGDTLRLCVVEAQHTNKTLQKTCPKLSQLGSPVECVIGNDRFNCLRKVAEENADFTVLGPEDLVAAAAWDELNVLVTNELRFFLDEKHQYQVAALMYNGAGIQSLSDVRGKRFCHPGYESTTDWTPTLATFFENTLIEKQCDPNKTSIENRVSAASKYFGAACMPGAWIADSKLDSDLKSQYRNLCALCRSPAACNSHDIYYGPEGALLCLTDRVGDIAWVRVVAAESHFENLKVRKEDYSYLCPDGSTRSMKTEEPCFWIPKPWPVIVVNRQKNEDVSKLMTTLGNDNILWKNALLRLLEYYHLAAINPENLGTPEDYLKRVPGFLSANIRPSCQPSRTIRWCVSSNIEQRKCSWLSQALSVYGVEPAVSCIIRPSRIGCIEAVTQQESDLFVITPEEELTAREKGLKRVLHVFTNKKEDTNKIAAVVKSNSDIKNLEQLKGLKACFTGYRRVGWNAFVAIMRNTTGSDWDSSDAKAVSNYFKESCVLGLGKENDTMPSNLYSLCPEGGRYGDETSAFKCLVNGGGDVAFISLDTIKQNTGSQNQRSWAQGLKENEFRPICFNESDSNTCFLTWTTLGSVMVNPNISSVRYEEIYSTLLQMDILFGQSYKEQTPIFQLYGSYDGNRSVIFPDQTQRLQSDISHVRLGSSYAQLVDDLMMNLPHNDARQLHVNSFQLFMMYIVISIASRMMS